MWTGNDASGVDGVPDVTLDDIVAAGRAWCARPWSEVAGRYTASYCFSSAYIVELLGACKCSRSLCVFFRGASNTRLHRPGECVSEHQRAAEGGPCSRRVRVDREPLSEWYIRVRPSVLRRDVHARRSRILCVGKERREGRGDCSVELGRLPRLQRQPLDAAEYVLYGRDRREGPAEDPRGVGADWGRDQERPQSIEDRRARAPAGASALGLRTRECSNGRLGLRLLPI